MLKYLIILILLFTNLTSNEHKKIYKVAFLKDWKPYYQVKEDGSLDGYVYDLFEEISKKTNIQFEYKIANDWQDLFRLAYLRDIDIVPNIGITKRREYLFLFTQPTDTFKIKLYKRKDTIKVNNINDLKDTPLGVMITNVCNKLITEEFTNKKVIFDSFDKLFLALTSGEVDSICYPEVLMNLRINELGLENKLIAFEKPLKEIRRGIGVAKHNFDLLPLLDDVISQMKDDGSLKHIYAKWFSQKKLSKISEKTFNIFLLAMIALLSILFFMLYLNRKLKKEHRKQKKLEEKLETAQKLAKVGHYNYYFDNKSFTCSKEIDKIFGLDESMEKNSVLWMKCVHPNDKQRLKEKWKESVEKNTKFHLEYRVINIQTNSEIWVIALGKIIRDEKSNPISMFGTIQNIDERKRLELKLSQAMVVFENTNDGILITDKDTNILNVNKSFELTTGYKLEEIKGLKPNILRSHLNDNDFYKSMWEEITNTGSWCGEIANKKQNHTIYYEILTINAIYDINKEVNGYIGIFTDITKHKDDEKIIFTQSKVAAVGEMLGNISHQWRQPLSIISSHATGLKVAIEFKNEEISRQKLLETMDKINEQTQYLSKTIDDFRNFFKGNVNDMNVFNIKTAFKKLEHLTKDIFNNNYIQYKFSIIDLELTTNENLFVQAFINILNNAKDAIVENTQNTDDRFIYLDTYKEKNSLIIKIKDTGGGIRKEVIDKIFEPYFTTKHQSIGTGIGLYMTHQIVTKQFKGTINVQNTYIQMNNKELKGTEFTLTLPI